MRSHCEYENNLYLHVNHENLRTLDRFAMKGDLFLLSVHFRSIHFLTP